MLDEWMQVIWEKETWWLIMWFVLESVDKAAFPKDHSGEAQERIWPKPAGAETGAERSRYLYGWEFLWRDGTTRYGELTIFSVLKFLGKLLQ